MLVPLSWLKEYVDIEMTPEELGDMLTIAGLEVEKMDYIGIPGGNDKQRLVWDPEKLVIGQLLKVEQHPNADRLVLATVEYGGEEPEVVVTGAPNLFAYLGQGDITEQGLYSPLALEGAELYDGYKEGLVKTKLKSRALRGIENRCMLCSEKELGISDEHEGIMLLSEGVPGTPLTEVFGDVVYELNIIPNIARCASIVGVAREVAALTGKELRMPDFAVTQEGPTIEGKVEIHTDDPKYNPRFIAMLIEGVKQIPSPDWMQRRLRLAGQRPINVVVDISNYVMLELGQPNHTFDYDTLRKRADSYNADGPIKIITRFAKDGEVLTTLDCVEHKLKDFNMLVTDPEGVLSLGGIMGGADSEINDNTANVLLEVAGWDFMNIRRSANSLKIASDAGFRFSRGVHPAQALLGAKRAAELLRTLAGGTVAQGMVDYYPLPPKPTTLTLTPKEVKRVGGITVTASEMKELLERLEFTVELEGEEATITSPDHRIDIYGTQDLVEEVCRMYGYDRIPTTEMADSLPPQRNNTPLLNEHRITDTLTELGLQEVITYRLTSPEQEARLLSTPQEEKTTPPYVGIANPISVDKTVMRRSVLASVMDMVATNSRFQNHIALFELGKVYLPSSNEGQLPNEDLQLALALTGPRADAFWQDKDASSNIDFFDLKGLLEDLFADLHIDGWHLTVAEHPTFRPGRTAAVMKGKKKLGIIGEIHPLVKEAFDIRLDTPILAAELDVEALFPLIQPAHKVTDVSTFPAVREDLALVVDANLPASEVEAEIRKSGGFLLQSVELFDVFQGKQVEEGKKSLAYHLTFQSPSKTLTDKEVGKNRKRIIKQLEKNLNAILR